MQLNPDAFNRHLNNLGQQFLWRRAFRCPCANQYSGAADPSCPQCSGKSWLWIDPVSAVAGMSSQKSQLKWAQFGLWQDGDAVVTVGSDSPMYGMGQFDRVTMLNNTTQFSLNLTRGGVNEKLSDPIKSVTRVFWLDGNSSIVDGSLPTVGADGSLIWPASNSPPQGTMYSISGVRFNEYFCWGPFPSERGEHQGALLPKRVVLRRFDLFGRDA